MERPHITGSVIVAGHDIEHVTDLLVRDNTVAELRQLAKDLGVKRERGSNKRATAWTIANDAGHMLTVERVGERQVVRTDD